MGVRGSGRHPVPTALHVLRGTRVRNRQHEPVGKPGRPAPPPEVVADPAALAHWHTQADTLAQMLVLTRAHGPALALLASALADHARYRAALRAADFAPTVVDTTHDRAGRPIGTRIREHPLIRTERAAMLLVARLLGEFGLTPVTQTKVHATDAPPSRASRYITGA